MREFNFFNDDDYAYEWEDSDLIKPKNAMALSTFLFETPFIEMVECKNVIETEDGLVIDESQVSVEKRNHSMKVYRLDGTSIYRVYVNYNMETPYVVDITKHPALGWVVDEFELTSDTVKQIGNIIDQHLYN
jgi:hypothetical protein